MDSLPKLTQIFWDFFFRPEFQYCLFSVHLKHIFVLMSESDLYIQIDNKQVLLIVMFPLLMFGAGNTNRVERKRKEKMTNIVLLCPAVCMLCKAIIVLDRKIQGRFKLSL